MQTYPRLISRHPCWRLVLVLLILLKISQPSAIGQVAGNTNTSQEVLFGPPHGTTTPHGTLQLTNVEVSTSDGYQGGAGYHLGVATGVAGTYSGFLTRQARRGEHIRLTLKARLQSGSGLFFGIGNQSGHIKLRVYENGRVGYYTGSAWQVLDHRIKHVTGDWQHYAVDYVIGSDEFLVTAGLSGTSGPAKQVSVSAPFSALPNHLEMVDRAYISSDSASRADIANVGVYKLQEEEIRDFPTFGKIQWKRHSIPFVSPGPDGGISGHALAAGANGDIYLAGGFVYEGDGSPYPEVLDHRTAKWTYKYSQELNTWTKMADLPERREYVLGIHDGANIYVLGGAKQDNYAAYASAYRMDSSSPTPAWETLPSFSVPRTHLAGAVVNGKLIAAGGNEYGAGGQGAYTHLSIRRTTEVLDLNNTTQGWVAAAPMPEPGRAWSASVGANGKLYVFGGTALLPKPDSGGSASVQSILAETLCYDPSTNTWTQLAPAPFGISGWRAALYKDRYAILVGGRISYSYANPGNNLAVNELRWNGQPLVYDTLQDAWYKLHDSATPPGGIYNDPGIAISTGKIFVTGAEAYGGHYNTMLIGDIIEWGDSVDRFESEAPGTTPTGYSGATSATISSSQAYDGTRSLELYDTSVTGTASIIKKTAAQPALGIEFLLYPVSATNGNVISLNSGGDANAESVFFIRIGSNGRIEWYDGTTPWNLISGPGSVSFNTWQKISISVPNPDFAKLSVNGMLLGTAFPWHHAESIDRVRFMTSSPAGTGDRFHIDNVRFIHAGANGFEFDETGQPAASYAVLGGTGIASTASAWEGVQSLRIADASTSEVAKIRKMLAPGVSKVLDAWIRPVAAPHGNIISFNAGGDENSHSVFHIRILSNGGATWYDGALWRSLAPAQSFPLGTWTRIRIEAEAGAAGFADLYVNDLYAGTARRWNHADKIDRIRFMSGSASGTGDEFHIDELLIYP